MQKWEYLVQYIHLDARNDAEIELNRPGRDGWELVLRNDSGYCVFKRRK